MSLEVNRWVDVCALSCLEPGRGAAALIGGDQVALFRVPGRDDVHAVDNRDPASGVNVLARGLVGSAGPVTYVASPMHKQRFSLSDGTCLDDEALAVRVWPVRVHRSRVEVFAGEVEPWD